MDELLVAVSGGQGKGSRVPGSNGVEPDGDSPDSIPLVRLLLDAPAARVTITWERK